MLYTGCSKFCIAKDTPCRAIRIITKLGFEYHPSRCQGVEAAPLQQESLATRSSPPYQASCSQIDPQTGRGNAAPEKMGLVFWTQTGAWGLARTMQVFGSFTSCKLIDLLCLLTCCCRNVNGQNIVQRQSLEGIIQCTSTNRVIQCVCSLWALEYFTFWLTHRQKFSKERMTEGKESGSL